jgi:hypothetical protein
LEFMFQNAGDLVVGHIIRLRSALSNRCSAHTHA